MKNKMNVLVIGADGFIGKNLVTYLNEVGMKITTYTRSNSLKDLNEFVNKTDFIFHLAGENRPKDDGDFKITNVNLTKSICSAIKASRKIIPVIFTSSTQAESNNPYGKSKLEAENILKKLKKDINIPLYIYRLPGVFGKWCKPNYNSVVATFCYNISHNIPIQVDSPSTKIILVYIDDILSEFSKKMKSIPDTNDEISIGPQYEIKLKDLAYQIEKFKKSRNSLITERTGNGFIRKLYATYISYLSPKQFSYSIPSYEDERGVFAEILKTKDSGQFSFFTVKLGMSRGFHYHHSKTEKFLVTKGKAKFRFRHILSGDTYEIFSCENNLRVVESAPGWAHNITNIGNKEMIVMLWANEIYNPHNPDTIFHKV